MAWLETRGDYENAERIAHSLHEIAMELKRLNDLLEKKGGEDDAED